MNWRKPRPIMFSPLQMVVILLWLILAENDLIQNDTVLGVLAVVLILAFVFGAE